MRMADAVDAVDIMDVKGRETSLNCQEMSSRAAVNWPLSAPDDFEDSFEEHIKGPLNGTQKALIAR